jgi:hypothetical protein
MMACEGEGVLRYSSTLSLTSALNAGGWLTPRPGRFIPGNGPSILCIGDWVGPTRAALWSPLDRLWRSADRIQSSVIQIHFYSVWTDHNNNNNNNNNNHHPFLTGNTTGSKRTAAVNGGASWHITNALCLPDSYKAHRCSKTPARLMTRTQSGTCTPETTLHFLRRSRLFTSNQKWRTTEALKQTLMLPQVTW